MIIHSTRPQQQIPKQITANQKQKDYSINKTATTEDRYDLSTDCTHPKS